MASPIAANTVIIGAGVAGSCVAIRLAQLLRTTDRRDAKIIVVEEHSIDSIPFEVGESMMPESKPLLSKLGVLSVLDEELAQGKHLWSTGNHYSWNSPDLDEKSAIFNPYGKGYHLDRSRFKQMLWRFVSDRHCDHVTVLSNHKLKELVRNADTKRWRVILESGTDPVQTIEIECEVLVDASGRRSVIQQANLTPKPQRISLDKLLAFVEIFVSEERDQVPIDRNHATLVESCESGWWYTTLLPNHTRIAVFHTDNDLPACKSARATSSFLNMLQDTVHVKAIIEKHGYVLQNQRIRCVAANSACLSEMASETDGWIAVGDSAMSFDPLSSQGLFTAIRCASFCAEAIYFQYLCPPAFPSKVSAFELYSQELRKIYATYIEGYTKYYATETRFASNDFWERRGK